MSRTRKRNGQAPISPITLRKVSLRALVDKAATMEDPDAYLVEVSRHVERWTATHAIMTTVAFKEARGKAKKMKKVGKPQNEERGQIKARPLLRQEKDCAGCGGEKFKPPVTPQEQERIVLEHFEP